ncbi:Phosphatidylinositol N-acetylglucosaminyltransferase subunit C [Strongyloides ratti]|uniref:Phosphatidylinositol N-acetylglucosaminyltransferase subunit C n=1 Tax=Strongyloides ratti TaxID=34506 RepID=A0A090L1I2_STRRB|nr:Phosphatidylinositol N-acetylglucosaminyltransferase subunit C [Strongyloides ratti]CEF61977.1 Phosphatidylinositol N-acetylglucosaminyltransferase subunit C [Strongyloides ratti]
MVEWKKILYRQQKNFPDNYVSKKYFLSGLTKNHSLRKYSFKDSIYGASRFTLQLNIIFFFYLGHYFIMNNLLSLYSLIIINIVVPITAIFIYWTEEGQNFTTHLTQVAMQALFCCCLTYAVSPILRTLGREIDTDSIYIASGLFFSLSIIFHDFGLSSPIVNMNFIIPTIFVNMQTLKNVIHGPWDEATVNKE